jgi:putative DNA primase/helicase
MGDNTPEPLPDELLPVAEFDFALLPETLRPWAQDICERVQCPPDFVAAGIMASLAAVIGRKIGIRPQARTDWTVVPNIWALVVGRPGVLKSPALDAALAPLNRLVAKANEDHAEADAEYKKEQAVAKLRAEAGEKYARKELAKNPSADVLALLAADEPDAPTLKRYKANDTSAASLGELLRQNANGLLVYRDELVSLLKGLDREDQAEGRGFYLTAWNGDSPYTFDRIGRGLNLNIEAICLSILGGTQPGRLAEYIRHAVKGGAADDGLIQRFGLLVWPDTGGTWKDVDRWPDTDAKNQAFKVFDYLDKIDPATIGAQQDTDFDGDPDGLPYLRFDAGGLELFLEWRTGLEACLRGGDLLPALESHFAKYRKLIPALALIIHLADGGSGPVTETATLQALAWGDYLETHARRAYGATLQPRVTTAKAILHRIKKGDLPASFSSRDVWRKGWAMLSDREQVAEALRLLVDYGHLREERNDETGGRPSTIFHVIEGGKQ